MRKNGSQAHDLTSRNTAAADSVVAAAVESFKQTLIENHFDTGEAVATFADVAIGQAWRLWAMLVCPLLVCPLLVCPLLVCPLLVCPLLVCPLLPRVTLFCTCYIFMTPFTIPDAFFHNIAKYFQTP